MSSHHKSVSCEEFVTLVTFSVIVKVLARADFNLLLYNVLVTLIKACFNVYFIWGELEISDYRLKITEHVTIIIYITHRVPTVYNVIF